MDYKELIENLREKAEMELCKNVFVSFALSDAATAIETLLAEKEAAMEDLRKKRCDFCKYDDRLATEYPCSICGDTGRMSDKWEWRGPQKGENND